MMKKLLISSIFILNAICFVSSEPPDPYRKIDYMVESNGYPFEKHLIVTEDGYFLEIHRIPGGKGEKSNKTLNNKPPVYVLHALTQSSIDWIAVGPELSLAFFLADQGFDVWLGNCRGNVFGRKHKIYLETSFEFWNYSWHQIGVYDIPATIDLILKNTGRSQIYYIGFSQGATASLVMGALRPEYNEKIRLAVYMAPPAYAGNVAGLGRVLFPIVTKLLMPIFERFGHFGFRTSLWTILISNILQIHPLLTIMLKILYTFVGPAHAINHRKAFSNDLIFLPGGISTKQIVHYSLGITNPDTFRQYDYGTTQNLKIYNSPTPPDYPLENVTMPIVIFQGINDYFATPKDVNLLVSKLPNVVESYSGPFNHIDFAYHRNMRSLVYNKIVELFKKSKNDTI